MGKMRVFIINILMALCLFNLAVADQILKPHTFSAGTSAKAEEVNANFDTVYDQVNKIGNSVVVDQATGNVGIGVENPTAKLDVAGGLKLGNSATCDSLTEGTLRYNTGEMQYCNGSIWKSLNFAKPVIWSGGCTLPENAVGGWKTYCADGVDFNTAADYISVNTNGTFTFLKEGYYRINFYNQSFGVYKGVYNGVIQSHYFKNGSRIAGSNFNFWTNMWVQNSIDQTFPFNVGDTLQIRGSISEPEMFVFLPWSDTGGLGSRLQVSFEGPLN